MKRNWRHWAALLALPLLAPVVAQPVAAQTEQPASGYAALLALYDEFRTLTVPEMTRGVPDYTPAAMQRQAERLAGLQQRLRAIDDSTWPIAERVDYMVVLAEMRGMEFQHRVMQPWRRDPAFYSTTNLGFGPKMHGAFGIPELPLNGDALARFKASLEAVPAALRQARINLTDPRGDLARLAIVQKQVEINVFAELAAHAAKVQPELVQPAKRAQAAAAEFKAWLESIEAGLPAHGGVGKENYAWYLKNVLLLPYTPEEVETIGEREYQRQVAFLKIEEHRNRAIPMPEPVTTRAAFDAKRKAEDEHLLKQLRDGQWVTIPDYVQHDPEEGPYVFPFERDPSKPGLFDPPLNLHFFFQAEFRDGLPLRAHNLPGHMFDGLQAARDTRPVRGKPRLFFVNGLRNEGWAFYLEEMILQAGMLEDRPKTREIDYILGAKRAARVVPEIRMQANEWTWKQANESLIARTPKWMKPGDAVAQFDIELYLRQPGYGIGYYMGKVELEKLLAEVAMQQGEAFDIKAFHDRFRAAGSIPISLIRWEMTGRDDEVRTMR
ncbi:MULTISPECIES: DUF885 family protein [Pseudomonadota]|jgi:hypothetical protein|uniref:DUF885 family protein n=1 Tax=Pseudomonadota TaxID=1224 RepID=UPI00076ABE09|nr:MULTISPECIES: DUF885 family protein [Pseudomonadota]MAF62225.1 DUF885 domain-containing protein [Blastomonas sp.]|tara:strand:+ start:106745 stop:108397 length:1653 start_codon:yes stop_codon:yes gene_type:complete